MVPSTQEMLMHTWLSEQKREEVLCSGPPYTWNTVSHGVARDSKIISPAPPSAGEETAAPRDGVTQQSHTGN